MSTLFDLLQVPAAPASARVYGVVTGVVTNVEDPEKLGRVKVRFPSFAEKQESPWARVAVPMAGTERGLWLLPEVDDEVLVAFEHGDPRFPYVVGALWSKSSMPPASAKGAGDVRVLRSRSGHEVRLDDTKGEEKIEIVDKAGKSSIVIRTEDNSITIRCEGDLTLESKGGKLVLKGAKGVEATSEDAMTLKASKAVELESSGAGVTVTGKTINLN